MSRARVRRLGESRQGVVNYQYFSTQRYEKHFLLCFGRIWMDLRSNFRYSNPDGRHHSNFRCAQPLYSPAQLVLYRATFQFLFYRHHNIGHQCPFGLRCKIELHTNKQTNKQEACNSKSEENLDASLCMDDSYTIAQLLEHRWPQAKVLGSRPGGDSQFFFRLFPFASLPQTSKYDCFYFRHTVLSLRFKNAEKNLSLEGRRLLSMQVALLWPSSFPKSIQVDRGDS